MRWIIDQQEDQNLFKSQGGGKATNMARMSQMGIPVPSWFCVSAKAFDAYIDHHGLRAQLDPKPHVDRLAEFAHEVEALFLKYPLSDELQAEITTQLEKLNLSKRQLAIRSSGIDEDSADHSFAGQFSSFLFQSGWEQVSQSIRKCWASGYSERALAYRLEKNLSVEDIRIGVVVQLMVEAKVSGVAFSRNPIRPLDRDTLVVDSVYGLGEGLVSGELDADHFEVMRETCEISEKKIVEKEEQLLRAKNGGLQKLPVDSKMAKESSLTPEQVSAVAKMVLHLEKQLASPQDCEWAIEADGSLYMVQTRPITTLPPEEFFNKTINGDEVILWDNSNIIESYSGVTSPLTFSFASKAYRQVYIQFCEVMGVPKRMIIEHESMYRNMLGSIRGNIYYNLINWYRLIQMLPGAGTSGGFMETMMGVKQSLKPELSSLFDFMKHPPQYSRARRTWIGLMTFWRFINIDKIVSTFQSEFNQNYLASKNTDFSQLSLPGLMIHYQNLEDNVLKKWHAPIINDFLCMLFFGMLKKFTENWVGKGDQDQDLQSLQNDLLCGQGELESTEPTKTLMRIAAWADQKDESFKQWLTSTPNDEIWRQMAEDGRAPELKSRVDEFLDKYGFRCINELKLEEQDLHDDPSFVINAIASYVRSKSYDIRAMEERETKIRQKAEGIVNQKLTGLKKLAFYWILKHARKAVKNRENLRFARTKIFGISRHIFRAMDQKFIELGVLKEKGDIFYLTVDEISGLIEGRPDTLNVKALVQIRKAEYDEFRASPPPPDRFLTQGAVALSISRPQVLADADLLAAEVPISDDPNLLYGTPCCPGIIEGVVRVAKTSKDAEGINNEILVTSRTDPGWVPLYPSCSGLLIERGSLLSHSAVVARELGLPTIVGISNGLMDKLQTGQRVRVDAGKGEVRILE